MVGVGPARRVPPYRLGLSNSRLEGINARIRLVQRRGFGIRDVDSLTSMIYLCLGGITVTLPSSSTGSASTVRALVHAHPRSALRA